MLKRITLTLEVVSDETREDLIEEAVRNCLCGFEAVHCGEWLDWTKPGHETREDVADDHEVEFRIVRVGGPNGTTAESMNDVEVAASH